MRTKWTYEMLKNEALKYNTRIDFKKGNPKAYDASRTRRILDDICFHMYSLNKYWSNDDLRIEAQKYNYRYNFQKGSKSAYVIALKRNILNDICEHMNGNIKWSYDMLKKEALKYNTRVEFSKGSQSAYITAYDRNILDDICSNMINTKYEKWTNYRLMEDALKYKNRSHFAKLEPNAYRTACERGMLDDICKHMYRLGNLYNRFIYVIEFENNSVYIGLTCDLKRRKLEHVNKSSNKYVNRFINETIEYKFNSDNILYSASDAILIECNLIDEYRNRGYNILNIAKGGGLGGRIKPKL